MRTFFDDIHLIPFGFLLTMKQAIAYYRVSTKRQGRSGREERGSPGSLELLAVRLRRRRRGLPRRVADRRDARSSLTAN